jgi:pimeloyl-ACP methyl ester carboxylesterase
MNTTDLLTRWSTLSLSQIEQELATGAHEETLTQLFGGDELAELRAVAVSRSVRSLSQREAVIFLPGLMGSLLTSTRGVTTLLWINPAIFLNGQSRYLELNQDGTADSSPVIHSTPFATEKLCYLKTTMALHRQCTLFEFPYDWRRPIESNGELLHQAIEGWADGDPHMQFTLVGHSMGGLVSRAYLAAHAKSAKRRIKRVIMHGTPHFGAAGAVADLMLGNSMMAVAERLNNQNDLRSLSLNMPSAYQLLPPPRDLWVPDRPYPVDFDVYDARAWRLAAVRQDYLDAGRRFHELLASFDHPAEMIEIAGCHFETTVDVRRSLAADDQPRLQALRTNEGADSGDGTVPLWSTRLPGAVMYYIQHPHRYLSRNSDVIDATIDLIYGKTPNLPANLPTPRGGLFSRRGGAAPPDMVAERLRARIENGTATQDDLEMLYFLNT